MCKAPAKNLHNGRRSSLNYNYFKIDSTIRYWCNSGFTIRGSGQIKCLQRNGKAVWSAYAPTCVGMYIHDHSYLMYIMCHCFIGNRNTQSHSRSRSGSDSRSNSNSHTNRRGCSNHGVINGYVKVTYYKAYGASLAQYYCKKGWKLHGLNRRVCRVNGRWIGDTPKCIREICFTLVVHVMYFIMLVGQKVINCGNPGSPVNGGRHLSSTVKGSIVKFYCKENYRVVGCSKRLCTDKGWTGRLPTCIG